MIRVLVVDDSVVFRSAISASLTGGRDVEVVGSAPNGRIALQKLEQTSVDVVTLDLEMPDMDGIELLKHIRSKGFAVRVIVFSSLTKKGAEKALEALSCGADDVLAKPDSSSSSDPRPPFEQIREILLPKVLQFRNSSGKVPENVVKPQKSTHKTASDHGAGNRIKLSTFRPRAIVVASSTGGPNALETIFQSLRVQNGVQPSIPILIAQHMPPIFTGILARRLGDISGLKVSEGKDGEPVQAGHVYIAPGDYHMTVQSSAESQTRIRLNQGPQRNSVRPAADFLFESASSTYGANLLGVVLTGMGEDGCAGTGAIKSAGGAVLIQNPESCVVFGMPGAVFQKGTYDEIQNLQEIGLILQRMISAAKVAA
jgi:two-component system chemotaxis response regulator CheB